MRATSLRPTPRLWRSRSDRVVAGVLGGLAEKFGLEARPIRLLYAVLTVLSGGALAIPYLSLWYIAQPHGPAARGPHLWRSRTKKVIAGVLGGLAEKFGWPPLAVRTGFVLLSAVTGGIPGLLVYLVLWSVTHPLDAADPQPT